MDKNIIETPQQFADKTGSTGIYKSGGYLFEEEIETLIGKQGAFVFDEMRRRDEIVAGMYGGAKNTILSGTYTFEPRSQSKKSITIADACKVAFFDKMDRGWNEILEEYTSILLYGYYLTNPITKIIDIPGFGKAWSFTDFSWRSPKTIKKWIEENDKLVKVQQQTQGDNSATTDMDFKKLWLISINKEGNNYEGISAFRAAYPAYYRKKLMHKIKLVGIERASLGFPDIVVPTDWKEGGEEYKAIQNYAKSMTSSRTMFGIRPEGSVLNMIQIPFDPEKIENVINSESTNMTYTILADFLMLGRQGGGNRMLGDSKRKTFLQSISYLAWLFVDSFNKRFTADFIAWNFGNVAEDDKADLRVAGIEQKAILEFSTAIKTLTDARLIKPDITLEGMLRDSLDLPPVSAERIDAEKKSEKTRNEAMEEASEAVNDNDNKSLKTSSDAQNDDDVEVIKDNKDKMAAIETELDSQQYYVGGIWAYREATKYETKCNFADIKNDLKNITEDFNYAQKNALNSLFEKYITDIRKRLKDGGNIFNLLADIEMTGQKELEKVITDQIKKAVISGALQIDKEITIKAAFAESDKLPAGVYAWIRKTSKRITENKVNDLYKKIDGAASMSASKYPLTKKLSGDETSAVIASAKKAGIDYIDNTNNLDGSSIIPAAINIGRREEALNNDVIGFQFSAILDERTTPGCMQLDGQTREFNDYDSAQNDPPRHFNCRSILIPITALEGEPDGGFTGFILSGDDARASSQFSEVKYNEK